MVKNEKVDFSTLRLRSVQATVEMAVRSVNPLVVSAVLLAVLIYSGIVTPKPRNNYFCLLKTSEQHTLEGKVSSNPIKNSKRQIYSCRFSPRIAETKNGEKSSCHGEITIFVPSEFAEAFFPGKLYTSATEKSESNAVLLETGAKLKILGKFSRDGKTFVVEKVKQLEWGKSFNERFSHFRALCRLQFKRMMYYWGKAGGLFLALISGSREYTDEKVAENFKNAGLSHILALSGMHLSLFSGLTLTIFKKTFGKKASGIFQFIAICLFVWFAGISPSLFRAFLCNTIMMIASVCNLKNVKMIEVVSLSFLLHVMIFPLDVFTLAFMLSYGALVGIILFTDFFENIYIKVFPPALSNPLAASTAAQGFTMPITLSKLGVFTPIGIISSVVISPIVTFFICSGLFLMILSFILPPIAPIAGGFMNCVYFVIEKGVAIFAGKG